jgi:hypothetical protein
MLMLNPQRTRVGAVVPTANGRLKNPLEAVFAAGAAAPTGNSNFGVTLNEGTEEKK